LMGLQGMQIEENAKQMQENLAGLQTQLNKFSDSFGKIGTHLKNAGQSYTEAETRLEKAEINLKSMLAGESEAQIEQPQRNPELPFANKQSA